MRRSVLSVDGSWKECEKKGLDNNLLGADCSGSGVQSVLRDDLKAAMKPERYTGRKKEQVR